MALARRPRSGGDRRGQRSGLPRAGAFQRAAPDGRHAAGCARWQAWPAIQGRARRFVRRRRGRVLVLDDLGDWRGNRHGDVLAGTRPADVTVVTAAPVVAGGLFPQRGRCTGARRPLRGVRAARCAPTRWWTAWLPDGPRAPNCAARSRTAQPRRCSTGWSWPRHRRRARCSPAPPTSMVLTRASHRRLRCGEARASLAIYEGRELAPQDVRSTTSNDSSFRLPSIPAFASGAAGPGAVLAAERLAADPVVERRDIGPAA